MMKNSILILFALLLVTSCNTKNAKKSSEISENVIQLTDAKGNEVKLDSVAQRVVCLFNPSVDVIYMLQAEDKLVGVPAEMYHDPELYDYFKLIDPRILNKEIAIPGSNELTNLESLIALKPDLVIAHQLSPSTITTLNNMGIAAYLAASESYDDLLKEMSDFSIMLGKEERGEELTAYTKDKVDAIAKRTAEYAPKDPKKVYFTWANGRIFTTAGRNSMMHNCLELAGVDNVCPTAIDQPNINPETLISWNPDMIVMWNDSPDLFYDKKEFSTIKAIDQRQIFNLMPMFYYNPHTFKAICTALAINNWAYFGDKQDYLDEVKETILVLYGDENGTKLIEQL